VLSNVLQRVAALPAWAKILLILAALVVLGLSVLLSPLIAILALLVLIVAVFALVIRALRHRPLRRWGIIAATSLVVLLVFSGISNALYFGGGQEQASSPDQTQQQSPRPEETTERVEKQQSEQAPQEIEEEEPDAERSASPAADVDESADGSEPSAKITEVMVTRVVDGDTIEISPAVDGKDTVRLIGIDAPEEAKSGCGAQPLAQEAADQMANWEAANVKLEFDEERTDRYGRLLAYVTFRAFEDIMVNEDMLLGGFAQLYIVPPNTKYEDKLREAQQEAKENPIDFQPSIWKLSQAKQDQLADRGNGIGKGDGACPPKPEPKPQQSTATSTATASPNANENNNVPDYDQNGGADSTASATASPSGDTPMSEEACLAKGGTPVSPGSEGDGDDDGCANE
jgi:micrococcal nuclease